MRGAAQKRRRSAAGNLAAFYQLQALTREGRRLLRAGQAEAAGPFLAEAVAGWEKYPDLHALLGLAQAQAGRWSEALQSAAEALRCNPDYVEARLLEAAALRRLGRPREAAASLDKLVESGRRVDHPLIGALSRAGGYSADNLPDDLEARIDHLATGPEPGSEVAAAVALCRAGRWVEGVENLRALCVARPDYPDYRLKLGAALYQLGRNDEALAALDHALAVHPHYHTAAHLKALVLADQGQFVAAQRGAERASADLRQYGRQSARGAVLRLPQRRAGVVERMPGRGAGGLGRLGRPDADLSRAANWCGPRAEDLLARPDAAGRRLAALADGLARGCRLSAPACLPPAARRRSRRWLERVLSRWPAVRRRGR